MLSSVFSPTAASLPNFKVMINSQPLPKAALLDLMRVSVNEQLDTASLFTLQLYAWDANQQKLSWVDDALFAVGNEVEIQMGYVDQPLNTVINGEIAGLDLNLSAGEIPTLTVHGYDLSQRLLRDRKTRTFTNITNSAIASRIASELGLSATVTDTQTVREYVMQDRETDMEFLLDLAKPLDYEVGVQGKALFFRPRSDAQPATLTLTLQADLIDFSAQLSVMQQVDQVQVRGWDVKQKKAIVSTAGSSALTGNTVVLTSEDLPESQAEADQMAQGRLNALNLDYIKGEGTAIGRTDLHAGMVVKINELGQQFSGDYYVTTATHTIAHNQGYRTQFTAKKKKGNA